MRQGQDGPGEIRKRNDGEWGTLPANSITPQQLSSVPQQYLN
jgi:hypothetical protein